MGEVEDGVDVVAGLDIGGGSSVVEAVLPEESVVGLLGEEGREPGVLREKY